MEATLKQFFSLADGRLSTEIGDVYEMLNYIFMTNLFTHQLPEAMNRLKEANPEWFSNGVNIINDIKRTNNTDDFAELMILIDKGFPTYKIKLGKIKSEFALFHGLENLGSAR